MELCGREDHRHTQGGGSVPCLPPWPRNKVLKANFQSIISQTNDGCSLLSLIFAQFLLVDMSCENIFAMSIVTALIASSFSVKKCVKISYFLFKNGKNSLAVDKNSLPLVI